jgi:hypothetical protein
MLGHEAFFRKLSEDPVDFASMNVELLCDFGGRCLPKSQEVIVDLRLNLCQAVLWELI